MGLKSARFCLLAVGVCLMLIWVFYTWITINSEVREGRLHFRHFFQLTEVTVGSLPMVDLPPMAN